MAKQVCRDTLVRRSIVDLDVSPQRADIQRAQAQDRIGFILTMEGAEPVGDDPHLLRIFCELGLRMLSLTHARTNAAAAGGIFAATSKTSHIES